MKIANSHLDRNFDPRFKVFHELMANKIRDVLLVSTPYDAWIMEEDARLSEKIINEYRGLNLSNPPRFTWASTAEQALTLLDQRRFDLVITMLGISDMDAALLGQKIKRKDAELPVILLTHGAQSALEYHHRLSKADGLDRTFVWSGNTDLLLALIKSCEDWMNVGHDTASAGIRVILFVEDSPEYISSLLPILYRELVLQTQAVMEEGLNEEHRLLTMRARPKILIAESFEEAIGLYDIFEPYILGVISDVRFERKGQLDKNAGVDLLKKIKADRFDIPLLLTSSEPSNAAKAERIPAQFVDKNSPSLLTDVRSFLKEKLGFGDFIFRMPDGREIAQASNLRSLEKVLAEIPDECFLYHGDHNDFSRWLFARSEIMLASRLRPVTGEDFAGSVDRLRDFMQTAIRERRKERQKGVVVAFDCVDFDTEVDFFRIGKGSLGGKARGLAFFSTLLQRNPDIAAKFESVNLMIPQTMVITTDGFEAFIEENDLKSLAKGEQDDEAIASAFLKAQFPQNIAEDLAVYLKKIDYPLAVRSSSLLEDAQYRAYAGLYRTYHLPNNHPDPQVRLSQLIDAIKLVYASTYYQGPKSFSKRVGHRTEEEKMAVIVQRLVGDHYGTHFYPALSGIAQSYNYYPFDRMKPEEGIATIVMGLGKMVMEGEKALRFSPRYPQLLPQRSSVDDILANAQQRFYALIMDLDDLQLGLHEDVTLAKLRINAAGDELPMQLLASTYIPEEHRIRDSANLPGYRVLTFAQILKHNLFPLATILEEVLALGQDGMGCPVELEFSVNLGKNPQEPADFAILQLRPMTARAEDLIVEISDKDIKRAFCHSNNTLGNTHNQEMCDIVYVKPQDFDPAFTTDMVAEIGRMNAKLLNENAKYLLIGPGRWGSADKWLGIPVTWPEICGVGAIIETALPQLKAEPSQGSHFFHNISTLGISYINVGSNQGDFLDWDWLTSITPVDTSRFIAHVHLEQPIVLKVDGRVSKGVLYV